MKRTSFVIAVLLLFFVSATALAQVLVVDRPLPIANLNNAAGADRSNVSWAFIPNNTYFSGDDFFIPSGGAYVVTKIRMWGTAGTAGNPAFNLSQRYTNATLYLGPVAGAMSAIRSGSFLTGTNDTDNPDITFARTTYDDVGNSNYQVGDGSYIQLWQADIANVFYVVNGGDVVKFGLHVLTVDGNRYWFNHSSNAALSGNVQQGANNFLRWFDVTNLVSGDGLFDSQPILSGGDGGWDKSSDVNIMVWAVPLTKDLCKKDGWKAFTSPIFKNQGACVSFVNHQ